MFDFTPHDSMHPALQALILVAVAIAVLTDVRRRKIYNKLTFPTMAVGLVLNPVLGGATGFLAALTGLALGFALFFIPVVAMGRGAGDLKLLAAVGALGGPIFVVWCALFTSVAGGIFALGVLLAKRQLIPVVGGMAVEVYTGQLPGAHSNIRLPYAIPIAVGAVAALVLR